METLDEALRARDEVAGSDEGRPSLSSMTWTQAANAGRIARNDRRELAAGALSLEIAALAASRPGGTAARVAAAPGR
jgi:hypothetical protein